MESFKFALNFSMEDAFEKLQVIRDNTPAPGVSPHPYSIDCFKTGLIGKASQVLLQD